MPLVLPNQGLTDWLDWMIRDTAGGLPDLVFTLFFNDIEPDQETVLDDLDRAGFGGFQEQVLTRADWTAPTIVDDQAVSQWGAAPTEWACTSDPKTTYGWAAYNFATLRLMIVERFDVPRPIAVGETLGVLPRFSLATAPG